ADRPRSRTPAARLPPRGAGPLSLPDPSGRAAGPVPRSLGAGDRSLRLAWVRPAAGPRAPGVRPRATGGGEHLALLDVLARRRRATTCAPARAPRDPRRAPRGRCVGRTCVPFRPPPQAPTAEEHHGGPPERTSQHAACSLDPPHDAGGPPPREVMARRPAAPRRW